MKPHSNIEQIRLDRVISQVFEVKVNEFHMPSRKRVSVEPRLAAMYLQKHVLKKSYPAIARHFKKKAHSTCISAVTSASNLFETDALFKEKILRCIHLYENYESNRVKQRYNLHYLITQEGIRVSGPERTVYVPQSFYNQIDGILKNRIDRLTKKHHYSLQLTII